MGSRIVARIVACRLKEWAESMGLMDDNQAGFRTGRSTADATQVMMRIQEETEDLRGRRGEVDGREGLKPAGRLLDLRKAYPRVSKPALWRLLQRYGLEGDFLRVLMDLHESTEYARREFRAVGAGERVERGLPIVTDTVQHLPPGSHETGGGREESEGDARGKRDGSVL